MALERPGYERFGLMANPFQDLTSETLEEIEAFHVDQDLDVALGALKQDVFEKRQKGIVALVGPLGAGKTERLRVTESEAKRLDAFCAFFQVNYDNPALVQGLAQCLLDARKSKGFALTQPAWRKGLAAVVKGGAAADPERAGKAIADALAENAPAFLLLNDLHNLQDRPDKDRFLLLLQAVAGHLKPGCMVMFTSYVPFFQGMESQHAPFVSRLNRIFPLAGLTDEQAGVLLAKRLVGHRIIEDLQPMYPFEPEAAAAIVSASRSNPRRFLQIADLVLEKAVNARAFRIDADFVAAAIPAEDGAPADKRPPRPAPPAIQSSPLPKKPAGYWTCADHPDLRDARDGECPECDAPLHWVDRQTAEAGVSAPAPQ